MRAEPGLVHTAAREVGRSDYIRPLRLAWFPTWNTGTQTENDDGKVRRP